MTLVILPLTAQAAPPQWSCTAIVKVAGDPKFYLEYGRDAWSGTGTVVCSSGGSSMQRLIKVNFNSTAESFGAGGNSVFNMTLSIKTTLLPKSLRVFASVKAAQTDKEVYWNIDSDATQSTVQMYIPANDEAVRNSLSRGTLYVR